MCKKPLLLLIVLLAVAGCKKDIDQFTPDPFNPTDPDPEPITFVASTFVEVVDINGAGVEDAMIKLNSALATTDENGVAYFKDVTMNPSTYLTVSKDGYFHGSRRFYPSPEKNHFVRVMLLDEVIAGSIQSDQGGNVDLNGVARIEIPGSAVVDQAGNVYEGTVDVHAQVIPADDPDLSAKMPGDLVGENYDGIDGSLGSAGMVVVELRSAQGDLLQVKDGSEVVLKMNVPAAMSGSVPSTIPMWFFDEEEGIWKEDGVASLQGNEYVANVGHFTYWNYDAWFPIVKWGASFVYENGDPAAQVAVCITIISMETSKCSYTNEEGVVCGMVAEGELLLMEVKDPCGNVVYSEQIGPYSDTTFIGPITIPNSSVSTTSISGSAEDCNEDPVTNGFARIQIGAGFHYVELESDGSFTTTAMNCDESDVVITVVDEDALKQSLPQTFDYALVIDAGVITVCENLTEFISLNVDGVPDPYVFFLPFATVQQNRTQISSFDSTTQQQYFFVSFEGTVPGTYATESVEIGLQLPGGEFVWANEVQIVVTYFGDIGDFIQGTISGTLMESGGGGGTYPMDGTFSVLRE